jgi:protein TonB
MRWSMLPVSAAAHAAAFLALLIVPLAAEIDLPAPASPWRRVPFLAARVVPDVPRVQPELAARTSGPAASPIPLAAPAGIRPEVPVWTGVPDVPGALPGDGPGVMPGAPAGVPGDAGLPPPPPPPPVPPAPVRPGGDIRAPAKIVHVPPRYPDIARAARVEGLVILEAIIDERGGVTGIRVLRSVALLDGAAIEAVRQWRYTPTLLNGVPVPVLMTITCRFSLAGEGAGR